MHLLQTLLLTTCAVFTHLSSAAPRGRFPNHNHSKETHHTRSCDTSAFLATSTTALNVQPTPLIAPALPSSSPAVASTVLPVISTPPTVAVSANNHFTDTNAIWKPAVGTTWQIELIKPVTNTDFDAEVFDLDLIDNPASTISTLHSKGRKVMCYFSAGTYENWRPDASSFQSSDMGTAMADWAGESWLDTNSANVRAIMMKRIDLAKSKGCDGVDPDNVDAYNNDNGLGLTTADAIEYLEFLAGVAHDRGLSIGLKNGAEIVQDVLPFMEWQVNEQCSKFNECSTFSPFIEAGKPVFHVEYPDGVPNLSASARQTSCASPAGFSSILKNLDLDEWVYTC